MSYNFIIIDYDKCIFANKDICNTLYNLTEIEFIKYVPHIFTSIIRLINLYQDRKKINSNKVPPLEWVGEKLLSKKTTKHLWKFTTTDENGQQTVIKTGALGEYSNGGSNFIK